MANINVGLGYVYHTFIFYHILYIKYFLSYVFTFINISVLWVLTGTPGPNVQCILYFNLSLLRSGAKLRSLGSGGSADLNVMVSELKDMRESAKGFMNAQNSGNEDLFT